MRSRDGHVKGQVRIKGVDVYDPVINVTDVRQRTGMIFQQPNLSRMMSIYDMS